MAVKQLSDGSPDGVTIGQSSTDLVAFYGGTPRARPAVPAAITDASGGTGAATNGVLTITATYNQAIIANALATIIASQTSLRAALVSVGIVA